VPEISHFSYHRVSQPFALLFSIRANAVKACAGASYLQHEMSAVRTKNFTSSPTHAPSRSYDDAVSASVLSERTNRTKPGPASPSVGVTPSETDRHRFGRSSHDAGASWLLLAPGLATRAVPRDRNACGLSVFLSLSFALQLFGEEPGRAQRARRQPRGERRKRRRENPLIYQIGTH
jgi:hypothetical protein